MNDEMLHEMLLHNDGGIIIETDDTTLDKVLNSLVRMDEILHTETIPQTNDEDGTVECYHVGVRLLTYEHDMGWFSSDLPEEPTVKAKDGRITRLGPEHEGEHQ